MAARVEGERMDGEVPSKPVAKMMASMSSRVEPSVRMTDAGETEAINGTETEKGKQVSRVNGSFQPGLTDLPRFELGDEGVGYGGDGGDEVRVGLEVPLGSKSEGCA
jgi:hypothetical protein